MRKIAFNDGWTRRHAVDSGKGKPFTIPHDAMLDEKRTPRGLALTSAGLKDLIMCMRKNSLCHRSMRSFD